MKLFRTPLTRPIRWALPLAIVGYALLIVVPILSISTIGSTCDPVRTTVEETDEGTIIERELVDADCADRRADRATWAFGVLPLFFLTQAPLTFFAVRGFLWGADALYELHDARGEPAPRDPVSV